MQRVIAQTAAAGQLISYGALCSKVRTIRFEPDSTALAYMLGEICRDEDALGRGLLTVIVVHKHGDKQPGPGFFEVAHELGRNTTDEDACWVAELKRVYGDWKGKHIPETGGPRVRAKELGRAHVRVTHHLGGRIPSRPNTLARCHARYPDVS